MSGTAGRMRMVGQLAMTELRLYAVILPWLLRRRNVPPGAEAWPYAALSAPLLWLWIFGSATEVVVFHLIIPWEGVRLVVDVISVWGLVWMVGLLAAYRVRPHLLLPDALRVRNSVQHDICVPTRSIVSATAREKQLPSSMRSLDVATDGGARHVSVGVSGRTNVTLTLQPGTRLTTAKGTVPADSIALWVDEPQELALHLNQRRAAAATRSVTADGGDAPAA